MMSKAIQARGKRKTYLKVLLFKIIIFPAKYKPSAPKLHACEGAQEILKYMMARGTSKRSPIEVVLAIQIGKNRILNEMELGLVLV